MQKVTIFPSKILLATEGYEEAELATRRAVDLADATGFELHVVYLGRLPNFLMNDPDIMGFYRKLYDEIERGSLELLWRLTWQVKARGGRSRSPPQVGERGRGDRGVGQGPGSAPYRHGHSEPRWAKEIDRGEYL
jgi:hypothetical protein